MSWFTDLFKRKQSQTRQALAISAAPRPVPKIRNPEDYAKEAFNKNVIAFRCIELVSGCIAQIPFLLFTKGSSRKEREEIKEHDLLNLLDRPNPMQGSQAFHKSAMAYLLLSGNSYIEAVGPQVNKVTELWTVRPDFMSVLEGRFGLPAGYEFNPQRGKKFTFPVDEMGRSQILHMKTFNPTDNWYGLSPIQIAALSVDQQNELNMWNLGLLQNSARPSGAFIVKTEDGDDGRLSEEQLSNFRREIDETYTGSSKTGRPMLLENGMDWKEMGLNPKDMEFLAAKHSSARDIALVFGVPPQLVGIPGDSTFNNFQEARLAFYQDTVLPLAEFYLTHLNNWLVPVFGEDLALDYDQDSIDALALLREKRWLQVQTATWLTTNEKREMTGFGRHMPSDDAADKILVNAGVIPLEDAAEGFDFGSDDEASNEPPPATDASDFEDEDDEEDEENESEELEERARNAYIEGKAFNLSNSKQKRQFWALQQRRRKSFERRFARQINKAFRDEQKQMSEALNQIDVLDEDIALLIVEDVLQQSQSEFEKVYSENLRIVMKAFGQDVLSIGKSSHFNIETKDAQSKFDFFLRTFIDTQVGDKIKNIQRTTRKRVVKSIREELRQGVMEGEGEPDLGKRVQKTYAGFTKSRAVTIARTEVHNASNVASRQAAKSLDLPGMQKEWLSALDDRTRTFADGAQADHTVMNGVKVDMNEKFAVPTVFGPELMDGPGDPTASAKNVINCFLPDNIVEGNVVAASRAFYSGQVLEVVTKSNARFTVTPNHPILTDKGFVPAKSLVIGQNLFRDRLKLHAALKSHDKQNKPALIKDVFQSLSILGDTRDIELTPQDFYGDASSMVGKVDIVVPDSKLLDKIHSHLLKNNSEFVLKRESMGISQLSCGGATTLSEQAVPVSSPSDPGGFTLSFDGRSIALNRLPLKKFRFGLSSHLDAMFNKVFIERFSNETSFFADLVQRFSSQIFADEIIDIRNFNYSGHVYDLQSDSGNLLADGIITSNCRCDLAYSAPLPD